MRIRQDCNGATIRLILVGLRFNRMMENGYTNHNIALSAFLLAAHFTATSFGGGIAISFVAVGAAWPVFDILEIVLHFFQLFRAVVLRYNP